MPSWALAHELRTPLNGLLSRIEAAEEIILPPPVNLAAVHGEAAGSPACSTTSPAWRTPSRQGCFSLDKQPVDLNQVVTSAAQAFASQFAEAGIAFAAHGEPARPLATRDDSSRSSSPPL